MGKKKTRCVSDKMIQRWTPGEMYLSQFILQKKLTEN